jgi:PmbA protein
MGKAEKADQSKRVIFGLRAFVGNSVSLVSTSETSTAAIERMASMAVDMAKVMPEDPNVTLLNPKPANTESLDIVDNKKIDFIELTEIARTTDEAGLAINNVKTSECSSASASKSKTFLINTNGLQYQHESTCFSIVSRMVAENSAGMETDYMYSMATHFDDLLPAAEIGRMAGEYTANKLNAVAAPTGQLPVIFSHRVGRGLLQSFASAISGDAVANKLTFLKDSMGEQIFDSNVTIIDNPFMLRGLRSKHIDVEGIVPKKCSIVEQGKLTSWFLDSRSSRQLKFDSTGHAARSVRTHATPAPTNLQLVPGEITPEDLMSDIKNGVYITSLMGHGVNLINGDYSRGATGFLIENGEITKPFNEGTIAGNLRDMFLTLTPANDLCPHEGIDVPTMRIDGMTVAGRL